MLNWIDFEAHSKNLQDDFESMCRAIFRLKYINNPTDILPQKSNNPGIEVEPVNVSDSYISFQAKYINSDNIYSEFLDSAKKIKKYYSGKINKVVFFSNKNFDPNSKSYQNIVNELSSIDVEIIRFCDNSILDLINLNEQYVNIKELFFGEFSLSRELFENNLKQAIDALYPKYNPRLHIVTKTYEKVLNSFISFSFPIDYAKEVLNYVKVEVGKIDSLLSRSVITKIDNLSLPNVCNYKLIFDFYNEFGELIEKINNVNDSIKEQTLKDIDNETRTKLQNELENNNYLLSLIGYIDFKHNKLLANHFNNFLIIEGDAGIGKSHLLGHLADNVLEQNNCNMLLFLGSKFVFDDMPDKQLMKLLNLNDKLSFASFIKAAEAYAQLTSKNVVIVIDALNECRYNDVWKSFFKSNILFEISKCNHVKLICSIRKTYERLFFDSSLLEEIKDYQLTLRGFDFNVDEAIKTYFDYYSIPHYISHKYYYEFRNPLFLDTFCKIFDRNESYENLDIIKIINKLLYIEEENINSIKRVDSANRFYPCFLKTFSKECFEKNSQFVSLSVIMRENPKSEEYVKGFLRANILTSYLNEDDEEFVSFNYERFNDYIIGNYILKNVIHSTYSIEEKINQIFKIVDNRICCEKIPGEFSACMILNHESHECFEILENLSENISNKIEFIHAILTDFISSLRNYPCGFIKYDFYINHLFPLANISNSINILFEYLISCLENDSFNNVFLLSDYLFSLSLAERDSKWTIYINDSFENYNGVYYLIENIKIEYINESNKKAYLYLLTWFLASSNRRLRDYSSKILVQLLKNDLSSVILLLNDFNSVNDPYVLSRLYGCSYGALLLSEDVPTDLYIHLTEVVYENIFNQDIIYPDILLRDYALNIIQYSFKLGIKLSFEISNLMPPYKKSPINDVSEKLLESEYPEYSEELGHLGTQDIKWSMTPEYNVGNFAKGMYGDFGRYTFQSSLRNFKIGKDFSKIFKYAYQHIIDLGYDNKLFTDYDIKIGTGRGRRGNIERIGKKYQWITMYHVLALVSDNYDFNEEYSDYKRDKYLGSWNPYVRDFDPSLTFKRNERIIDTKLSFNEIDYNCWDLEDPLRWVNKQDSYLFDNLVNIKDSNGCSWTHLYGMFSRKSSHDYSHEYEDVWLKQTACIVYKKDKPSIISDLSNCSFVGRWFGPAEVSDHYNLFLHEYCWSPAFKDEIYNDGFIQEEIKIGSKKERKVVPDVKISGDTFETQTIIIEDVLKDVNSPIMKKISPMMTSAYSYLWEEEYDFSKDETITMNIPCKFLVDRLRLKMDELGVWRDQNNEIVCIDFSFVMNSNLKGLYIKTDYLKKALGNEYDLVWIGMGEKLYSAGNSRDYYRSDFSSLLYKDNDDEIVEMKKFFNYSKDIYLEDVDENSV